MSTIINVPSIRENLNEEELRLLTQVVQVRHLEADEVLVHHGEVMNEVFVLHSGQCNRSVPHMVGKLQVGDVFGESALVKGSIAAPQTVTASAEGRVTALSVSFADLDGLGFLQKIRAAKLRSKSRCIGRLDEHRAAASSPSTEQQGPGSPSGRSRSKAEERRTRSKESVTAKEFHVLSASERKIVKEAVQNNRNMMELLQLTEEHLDEIANCVTFLNVEAGSSLVRRGELGDAFFVIADGVFEVISDPDPENPLANVSEVATRKLRIGDSFGEQSLLYDSPVCHTVVPTSNASVWMLQFEQWRSISKIRSSERLENYKQMLAVIEDLEKAVPDRLQELAEALEEVYLMSGETFTNQGVEGDTLYILCEGSCKVFKDDIEVGKLARGDYVGVSALLANEPYESTVVVDSDKATVLALDRMTLELVSKEFAMEFSKSPSVVSRTPSGISSLESLRKQRRSRTANQVVDPAADVPMERLEMIGVLGAGAFAVVTLRYDKELDRLFALKRVSKKCVCDLGIQEKVLAEKNTLAQMQSEFVVSLVRTYQDHDSIYFLMKPALGGELFELFTSRSGWFGSQAHASFFTVCVCLGLEHMHSKKIIHRDVKLENLLLDQDGYAQITDMGLAKTVVGKTYTVCGTADYLAPETLRQVGHNRAVDWWALGVLVFVMMAGRSPFDADDVMQIYRNIVKGFRKDSFPSKFSPHLVDMIKSLCKKKPEDRIAMLPGGVKNLKQHPWLTKCVDFDAVARRTAEPPFMPGKHTTEEYRKTLLQDCQQEIFAAYEDDGSGWSDAF
jgi:cGMP-dependent protein kinase